MTRSKVLFGQFLPHIAEANASNVFSNLKLPNLAAARLSVKIRLFNPAETI